jgi:peptidoglycan hydrolase-like protein with peptidoglycan-binding domain
MELLAYIQEESIYTDDAIANESTEAFQTWLKKLTTKSAKLSLSVLLTGTTLMIGLGSTLNALAAETPSSDVKYVQSLLAKNGFDPGAIDGVSGASTKNAILRAQKAFGLTPDGIVGSQTISALENGKASNAIASNANTAEPIAVVETTTSVSSTVMNLQKLLADRGFYNGAVDGIMGSQTRSAIIAAQKAYNLTADGVAGPQTLAALESDGIRSTATPISTTATTKSADISNLQELLSKRGFYNGAVDGIMGSQTRAAIIAAQRNYGLATDGIAGTQTLAALESGASNVNIATKPSTTSPAPTVTTTGDTNVMALQQLLAKRGFYNGAIDGVKGAQTSAAITAAQKAYGLTTDGIAGRQTIAALQADARPSAAATPVTGNQAAASNVATANDGGVANLQNLLTDRGFYNGPITGFLGTRTREAIIAAQKAYGLTADGVAGARTIAALEAGAPKQQIAVTNVTPTVTPTIRVEPKPQVTPQPTTQPQAVATPQPTVQATPKPAPVAQPTTAPVAQPITPATTANTQVSELQRLLAQRGFYTGKVDGVLSGETRNAIVRAQNFYTISPADGAPSNKLIDSLSKDTFISEGN